MRTQRVPVLVAVFSAMLCATALANPPKVRIDFPKLLPDGWAVVSVDSAASAPYGWAHDLKNPGIAVRLEGPTEVNNRGLRHEGVTLTFMPPEYVPGEMQDVQLTGAAFLGKTDDFQLFVHVWPDTPTWKTCRGAISKYFGVKTPNRLPGN